MGCDRLGVESAADVVVGEHLVVDGGFSEEVAQLLLLAPNHVGLLCRGELVMCRECRDPSQIRKVNVLHCVEEDKVLYHLQRERGFEIERGKAVP